MQINRTSNPTSASDGLVASFDGDAWWSCTVMAPVTYDTALAAWRYLYETRLRRNRRILQTLDLLIWEGLEGPGSAQALSRDPPRSGLNRFVLYAMTGFESLTQDTSEPKRSQIL